MSGYYLTISLGEIDINILDFFIGIVIVNWAVIDGVLIDWSSLRKAEESYFGIDGSSTGE